MSDGWSVGGAAEADAAYEEAFDAIFNLAVESYRHPIPQISKKNGQQKWSMIEMWPMTDPVTNKPAVLVFVHNITQQKQMEMQLAQRQEALQRENQDLEQNRIQMEQQTAAIQREKEAFQQEALELAKRLEAVIHDKFIPKSHIDADTPIDKTLNFLHAFVAGENPSVQSALDVYHILTEGDNALRQPVGLATQLLKESSMDSEVGMSMLQLLSGPTAFREGASAEPIRSLSRTTSMLKPTDRTTHILVSEDSISASLVPTVERLLADAETNWQFDIFGFAEQAQGSALFLLTFHFMQRFTAWQEWAVDKTKLATFVRVIEKGYDAKNPYHNSTHVASVVQMTHLLLQQAGIAKVMSPAQIFATYCSALIHDFEHLGVNNDYLIKSFHPLAVMYNDISPLENHHVAAAGRVMQRPECRFVKDFGPEGLALFRPTVIQEVLATDMKKHFEILSRFQTAFKRAAPTSATDSGVSACPEAADVTDWDNVKPDDKTLVFQMLLKCADIGHLAADLETHKKWAYQLEEEFFQQGDREKEIGLTVSPLMDRRHKGGITRSQMGFFTIVGLPMFKAMADVFEGAKPMLEGVMGNYRAWEAAAAAADAAST
ncbi:putative 3',5'-cyclic phosphodiesterase pde-3 [Trebouxia sp. C0010 RCD-2024]